MTDISRQAESRQAKSGQETKPAVFDLGAETQVKSADSQGSLCISGVLERQPLIWAGINDFGWQPFSGLVRSRKRFLL
jgi:hypothetical protein